MVYLADSLRSMARPCRRRTPVAAVDTCMGSTTILRRKAAYRQHRYRRNEMQEKELPMRMVAASKLANGTMTSNYPDTKSLFVMEDFHLEIQPLAR